MKATAILRHRNKKKSNTAALKRFAIRWMRDELLKHTSPLSEVPNSPFSEKTAKLVEQVLDKKGEKLITKSVRHTNKKYPILSDDFAFDNMTKQDIDLIISSLSHGTPKTQDK